jgi:20S proteasome subunit alpha 7
MAATTDWGQARHHLSRHGQMRNIQCSPLHATGSILIIEQGYYGAATGKGRQAAKSELEKLNLADGELSLEEGVKEAARIIYVAHDDNKDKEFELEMTWISSLNGPTKGRHEEVPKELREEAEKLAKKALEGDDDEDEEKMEE